MTETVQELDGAQAMDGTAITCRERKDMAEPEDEPKRANGSAEDVAETAGGGTGAGTAGGGIGGVTSGSCRAVDGPGQGDERRQAAQAPSNAASILAHSSGDSTQCRLRSSSKE